MKILLLLVACLSFIPVIFLKKFGNKLYVITILIFIALNLFYETQFQNEKIYIPILSIFLIITIPFLFLRNKNHIIKYKKKKLSTLFLISTILLILVVQFLYFNLYDFRLYFYTFFSYLNVILIFIVFLIIGNRIKEVFYLKIIAFFSLFNSILGLLQYTFNKKFLIGAFNESIEYFEGVEVIKRAVGFIGANNGAGNLGATLFPFLVYYCVKKKSFFSYIVLTLNLVFTFLTFTRAGLLSIAVVSAVLVFYYLLRKTHKTEIIRKFSIISLIIFSGVVFWVVFFDDFFRIFFEYRGNTGSYRFYQFEYALRLLYDNYLLGIGAGNFDAIVGYLFSIQLIGILHSHFLNIIVEQGVISFVLYIAFNYLLFNMIRKEYKISFSVFPYLIIIAYIIPINFNANQYYELNIYIYYFAVFSLVTAYKSFRLK